MINIAVFLILLLGPCLSFAADEAAFEDLRNFLPSCRLFGNYPPAEINTKLWRKYQAPFWVQIPDGEVIRLRHRASPVLTMHDWSMGVRVEANYDRPDTERLHLVVARGQALQSNLFQWVRRYPQHAARWGVLAGDPNEVLVPSADAINKVAQDEIILKFADYGYPTKPKRNRIGWIDRSELKSRYRLEDGIYAEDLLWGFVTLPGDSSLWFESRNNLLGYLFMGQKKLSLPFLQRLLAVDRLRKVAAEIDVARFEDEEGGVHHNLAALDNIINDFGRMHRCLAAMIQASYDRRTFIDHASFVALAMSGASLEDLESFKDIDRKCLHPLRVSGGASSSYLNISDLQRRMLDQLKVITNEEQQMALDGYMTRVIAKPDYQSLSRAEAIGLAESFWDNMQSP